MTVYFVMCLEMLESVKIELESSAAPGGNHNIKASVSDIVIVVSSTAVHRLLAIVDTTSAANTGDEVSCAAELELPGGGVGGSPPPLTSCLPTLIFE